MLGAAVALVREGVLEPSTLYLSHSLPASFLEALDQAIPPTPVPDET